MYVIIAILIFGVLIAIHEFGHFITAKLCGVRVLEFSIGMGPALVKRQGKETLYSLRLLPIGGFCAMEGEDSASTDPRAFTNQNRLKKTLILVAGAGMNFLLGLVLIIVVFSATSVQTPEITGFMEGCPYESADGFQAGDIVWKIDGHRVYAADDISTFLGQNGTIHDITVKRDGKLVTLEHYNIQRQEYVENGETVLLYGFRLEATASGMLETLQYAWYRALYFVRIVWMSLIELISGNYGVKDLSGVVGVVDMMSDVGKTSGSAFAAFMNLSYFSAFIAINLAVMNLLPIPALDGGRIFFLLLFWPIEKIRGRKVDPKYEGYVNSAFLVLLMVLMVYVMFNDVVRIVS